MAAGLLAEHWNRADVEVLAGGVDAGGRRLPSQAWMALRRLGGTAGAPEGVTVNDRIVRMSQEQAGRLLRSAAWRAGVTAGVLATWPADSLKRTAEEWNAVRAAVPGGRDLPSSLIKTRTRQIASFLHVKGRLPVDVFELEGAPRTAAILLPAACDRQQATFERSDSNPQRALLRLQLPIRPDPQRYADWAWVACPIILPPTVPAAAVLHLPTLRVQGQNVRAEVAYTHAVPRAQRTGHTVALGVDWGLNTLLSAGAVRLHADGRLTALGAGAEFRAAGVLAKQHRLRRLSEWPHSRADCYQRLIDGRKSHQAHPALEGKLEVLSAEIRHISTRRTSLNEALAWSAARWAVDQAAAAGATAIYLEDLRSLEARGMGRTLNTRLSQQVRGQISDRIRHLAAESGIAARGLTHQATTAVDQATGQRAIRSVANTLEAKAVLSPLDPKTNRKDRSKTGPTRRHTTRSAPRRRRAPSPARPNGQAGRRPEGPAPTDRRRLPRAAHRHQGGQAISTPTRRHRPRGAALGAGFYLHAHATPPRWEAIQSHV
ncbi:transposase [Nonomuraea sp. NPDC052116]|uniref:transposase n=1 Tax=Nonomuraea sp. NPDC052116 TaxID=3155665 RepID=UPI0034372531